MIVVSGCLCGINCKYNGGNNLNPIIKKLYEDGKVKVICPECLGNLPVPREPNEIINGTGADVLDGKAKVKGKSGLDNTEAFVKGAYEALEVAKMYDANIAILKGKSPSCGAGIIYDGTFSGNKITGNGVTAELFKRNGIKVYTEENYLEELKGILDV